MFTTKQFSLSFGFDVFLLGVEEHREIEIEIKMRNVDEKKFLKGSTESLDTSPLNMVTNYTEKSDHHGYMDYIDKDITDMGDFIEYSINNAEEGEENFRVSLFLVPRYDMLLIKNEDGGVEEYSFRFEDYVDSNNIPRRTWKVGKDRDVF